MVMVMAILNGMDDFENFFYFDISFFLFIVKQVFNIYFCFIVIIIAPTIPNNNIIELIINHIE